MRVLKRWLAALSGAVFVAVLAADVSVLAQRDYRGPLFWMAQPEPSSGVLWVTSPRRAWPAGGVEWAAATSFPARVWEFGVDGAPPNDPCQALPVFTDPFYGPYGLQVSTYLAEWWEGTTFAAHPYPPSGYSRERFGFFDFRRLHGSGRAIVGADGVPADVIGNPSACAGRALALAKGQGADRWQPLMRKQGLDCLSIPHIFRARMNFELRCEADLSRVDRFSERFWLLFDSSPLIRLPDGYTDIEPIFPSDYPYGPFEASSQFYPLGRVWARRLEVGFDKWVSESGNVPIQTVFNIENTGGFGAVARHRPEYEEPHGWRLAGTAEERRALARNPFVTMDHTGAIVDHEKAAVFDGMRNAADCVALNVYSYENALDDSVSPCGRPNSAIAANFTLEEEHRREENAGLTSSSEVETVLTDPMITGAFGNRQPFPIASHEFWLEWNSFISACTAGFFELTDLPGLAHSATDHYRLLFALAWSDFLDDPTPEHFHEAVELRGMQEGWALIARYRDATQLEFDAAFEAAGYRRTSGVFHYGHLEYGFEGAPPPGCDTSSITLQPMRAMAGNYAGAPAGGLPGDTAHLLNYRELEGTELFGHDQDAPHYATTSVFVATGAVSDLAESMILGPGEYPSGPTHWDTDVSLQDSPDFYTTLSCPGEDENVFAPGVEQLPILPHWTTDAHGRRVWTGETDVRYQSGVRVEDPTLGWDPRSIANYAECENLDVPGDCYQSGQLAELVGRYDAPSEVGRGRTLTSHALDARREAGAAPLYLLEHVRDSTASDIPDLTGRYRRMSSGDVDAAGERIMLDGGQRVHHPTNYAVSMVNQKIDLSALFHSPFGFPRSVGVPDIDLSGIFDSAFSLRLFAGVADLDYRFAGASLRNRLTIEDTYWGVPLATLSMAHGAALEPDQEYLTRDGPIRFAGAMELASTSRLGTCTLCSEFGCDRTVSEDFVGERFTASVTGGTIVCRMQRGLTPPNDCPGP